MDLQTLGPSFSSSRVLRFGDLSQDEQESFVRFFAEQKVSFFRDLDGSYVANVRLYDPSVIDMSATNSTAGATSRGNAGKVSENGTKRRSVYRPDTNVGGPERQYYGRFDTLVDSCAFISTCRVQTRVESEMAR
jgi:hypothetical protein